MLLAPWGPGFLHLWRVVDTRRDAALVCSEGAAVESVFVKGFVFSVFLTLPIVLDTSTSIFSIFSSESGLKTAPGLINSL